MKSEFDRWFKEQFGKQPGGNKSRQTLSKDAFDKYHSYQRANDLLTKRDIYEEKRTVASYAWNARGKVK